MPYTHAERLSALDVSFLELEEANAHMHIGAVAVFEAAPVICVDLPRNSATTSLR